MKNQKNIGQRKKRARKEIKTKQKTNKRTMKNDIDIKGRPLLISKAVLHTFRTFVFPQILRTPGKEDGGGRGGGPARSKVYKDSKKMSIHNVMVCITSHPE